MAQKNAWNKYKKDEIKELESLCKDYREFLDNGKTERECVKEIVRQAEDHGYRDLKKIIKNKESALRMEVKRCKADAAALDARLEKEIQAYEAMFALWNEFDASLIKVSDVHLGVKKIAGVRVPLLENVDFEIRPYSLFNAPKWYADGLHLLKELAHTAIEREFTVAKLNLLEHARKKTTQKVNLFEKVQIPGYQDALRKIKRFMEDEENLSKSSQKIMKSHQEKRKEAEA